MVIRNRPPLQKARALKGPGGGWLRSFSDPSNLHVFPHLGLPLSCRTRRAAPGGMRARRAPRTLNRAHRMHK